MSRCACSSALSGRLIVLCTCVVHCCCQELDTDLAAAAVERAKQRFSVKVRTLEEMRLRYAHARKQLNEKKEREKAERRRGMLAERRAEVASALGDSSEFAAGAFAPLPPR